MSDNTDLGFGKFVPGFDFLQNLAKGASQALPQMPNLSNWVAPTLSVDELEKRIGELKAVHFWLDQNSKALAATIQALEVQKMTLATLKGMNFNMGDVADALKLTPAGTAFGGVAEKAAEASGAAAKTSAAPKGAKDAGDAKAAAGAGASVVDPLQWWGALTQQFQQIAATAMKDVAAQAAMDAAAPTAKAATGATGAKTSRRTAKKPAR